MNWRVVESDEELAELLSEHRGAELVAVDTEFMRRNTFYPQAALIQLGFEGEDCAWLIDPLLITDFEPLRQLFQSSTVKILHSPSEDLEVFQQLLGVQPEPMFDTQRAAAFLDMGHGLGYRGLVEELTGELLPKGETRSDWLQRPLTDSQLEYAALDVLPVPGIYRQLCERLQEAGKHEWLLEDGSWMMKQAQLPTPFPLSRFKTAWKLNSRQLELLTRIRDWREQRARDTDKPRSWILADNHCLQIAQRAPGNEQELQSIEEFPSAVVRKQGRQLLDLVSQVEALPEDALPERLPAPLNADQRNLLKKLKQAAKSYASDRQMAPELMLPSKDYELLVRQLNGEAIEEPVLWQGWRKTEFLQGLRDQFKGSA